MACLGLRCLRPEEKKQLVTTSALFAGGRQDGQQREPAVMMPVRAQHRIVGRCQRERSERTQSITRGRRRLGHAPNVASGGSFDKKLISETPMIEL